MTGLHVREAGEDSRTIAGYAVMFNVPSEVLYESDAERDVEVISPEAISKAFLDKQDIKMTLFHDRELVLARSNKGKGTLKYEVDAKGVKFEFDAPRTVDGDKALELVRRGDIAGCSFAFSTDYSVNVDRTTEPQSDGKVLVTYTVRAISALYDFTLTTDPAYPATSVGLRDLLKGDEAREKEQQKQIKDQITEMRKSARMTI